jgi:hypothetical protein
MTCRDAGYLARSSQSPTSLIEIFCKVTSCRRVRLLLVTKSLGSEVLPFQRPILAPSRGNPSFRALRRRRQHDNRQGADVAMDAQCRNHANSIVLNLAVPKPEY